MHFGRPEKNTVVHFLEGYELHLRVDLLQDVLHSSRVGARQVDELLGVVPDLDLKLLDLLLDFLSLPGNEGKGLIFDLKPDLLFDPEPRVVANQVPKSEGVGNMN